jgi:hypothetical protein
LTQSSFLGHYVVTYTPVTGQRPRSKQQAQQSLLGNSLVNSNSTGAIAGRGTHSVIEDPLEAVFSVLSVQRLFNEEQLQLRVVVESWLVG